VRYGAAMRARRFWPIAPGLGFFVVSCGLSEGGLGQAPPLGEGGAVTLDGGHDHSSDGDAGTATPDANDVEARSNEPDDTGSSSDVASDASLDAFLATDSRTDAASLVEADSSCGSDSSSCILVPAGWTLVAFAPTQSSPCPAGFTDRSTDLVEGPTATTGACSCGACSVTSPPSCASGSVPVHYDESISAGAGSCALLAEPGTGPLMNDPPGSCGTDLYQGSYAGFDISYTSPPPTGGACTAPGIASGTGVTYGSQDRSCTAASAQAANCNGNACAPSIAAPFQACLMTTGTATCPGNMTARHLVGTGTSVTCADCACSTSATCTGTVTLYTDSTCMTGAYAVSADGSCDPIHLQRASYDSYIYSGGSPQNVTCQASGSSAPSVTLANEATICCTP